MVPDFRIDEWTVRPARHALVREDEERRLSHKAMAVLLCLAKEPGRVVSKEALFETVWEGRFTSDEVLTTAIYELRRALGDKARHPRYVETIRKSGYRLVPPVEFLERPSLERERPALERTGDAPGPEPDANNAPSAPDGMATESTATGGTNTKGTANEGTNTEDVGPSHLPQEPEIAPKPRRTSRVWVALLGLALLLFVASRFLRGPQPTPEVGEGAKPEGEVRSVAVLPLEDLDGEPDRFADALTERLILDLVVPEGPEVLPSLMTRGATDFTREQLASQLGADAVVEGSILRSGDRLWISVQLVDVRTGRLLWGGEFERRAGDALDLQRELSEAIVSQIHSRILLAPELDEEEVSPGAEAADAFELGTYFLRQGTPQSAARAEAYFRLALELDPDFSPARVGLVGSYLAAADEGLEDEQSEVWKQARAELATVLELDKILPSPPICGPSDEEPWNPFSSEPAPEDLLLCLAPDEVTSEATQD